MEKDDILLLVAFLVFFTLAIISSFVSIKFQEYKYQYCMSNGGSAYVKYGSFGQISSVTCKYDKE